MSKYHCSKGELISGMELLSDSLNENLSGFQILKLLYDALYVAALNAEIDAVAAMPDNAARQAVHRLLRLRLSDESKEGRRLFRLLKRYIETAFVKETWDIRFSEAGQGYYATAGQNDWESNKQLLMAARNFISANSAALLAGNNMPVGFGAEVTGAYNTVRGLHIQFLAAEEAAQAGTQAGEEAAEALFDRGTQIMRDGKEVADGNEALEKEFTWTDILQLVRGSGVAGVRGYVKLLGSADVLEGVMVEVPGTDYSAVTNETGYYEIRPMAGGEYTIRFSKVGFMAVEVPHTVQTGTLGSLSTEMAEEL